MIEIINGLIENYGQFFSINNITTTLADPVNWGVIFSLIVLEGLLSSDNALVLAIMVRHLPPTQRKKALFYGIWGAYFFRFLAIGLGTFLIRIWWIKVLGGLYLLYLVYKYIKDKGNIVEDKQLNVQRGLIATIVVVEFMDISFSVDSITAAFGISEKMWVLFLGGILGITMMRGIANMFVKLINNVPELETTAYILITIVGIKMIASTLGYKLSEIIFFAILITVFTGTIGYHYMKNGRTYGKTDKR